ncbi:MAG: DUF4142 domain-containing protein [Flavobacterium sp.]|uniref:DUF4142 domain-containing protein n=1 Tax=Flavobacterium sp. TaxID=239 RepID=UPI0012073236|nr:DUF4142 domain-containing protein [Flavobacterium sp.]RZJ68777.1 MAG: DUF4142 domain-containing protein [Flavobacterium sp.]
MKAIILTFVLAVTLAFTVKPTDPKEIARFLTEAADARMMDREEGKLAIQKGTTKDIRDYGEWMVKDQTALLGELEKVAAKKNVMLPKAISDKKQKALTKLSEKTGADFDRKFLSMIKIDHKRDVKQFKKASKYSDIDVMQFATEFLPMIEKHLSGVKAIKQSMK